MGPDPESALEVRYVDEARTHEVFAAFFPRDGGTVLRVVEVPFGSHEMLDVVERVESLSQPWEARLALRELEARLAASGSRYFRLARGAAAPEPLPLHPRAATAEPRAVPIPEHPGSALRFHHYHRDDGADRLQLAVPRLDLPAERFLLANLDFRFPDVAAGALAVVHPRLSPATLRQRWVDSQLDLPREGYRRLDGALDYAVAFGPDWRERWDSAWRGALTRVLDGDFTPRAPAPAASMPAPEVGELQRALASRAVASVLATYLPRGEAERVVGGGELGIRRHVQARRKGAPHSEQTALSLLEAALLVTYARKTGRRNLVEEEGARVVRLVQQFEAGRRAVA